MVMLEKHNHHVYSKLDNIIDLQINSEKSLRLFKNKNKIFKLFVTLFLLSLCVSWLKL